MLWFVVALTACGTSPNEPPRVGVVSECLVHGRENARCDAPCVECQSTCGNGVIDPGEQCDDGNSIDGDGCESNCTLPACGNGIRDTGEQCDDGNSVDGDGCESDCTLPVCGNGIRDAGEQCDDGNRADGDGCDSNCTLPACGNGIRDAGEQCDDGNSVDGDGCESDCTLPACGNGIRDVGEQCDDGNRADGDGCDSNCTLPACGNGIRDVGEQCDDGNSIDGDSCESDCTLPVCRNGIRDVGEQCDDGNLANGDGCSEHCTSSATTYVKASNTAADDQFGIAVALSADGSTLAVGAPLEASAATGVNGDQSDRSASASGAVYVFTYSGGMWSQQAYLKASNTRAGALFGMTVALSADGSTLAVGSLAEASGATGVDGDQGDRSAPWSGAVYVFTRTGAMWQQQAYVKASNTAANDQFSVSVALTADGSTLAVGAVNESSGATGIDGNQADRSAPSAGAVYVFARSGATWTQQAYIKASNTGIGDGFGASVALSAEGTTLAVGASTEDSAAIGINGDQSDNSALASGAVYMFTHIAGAWMQQAYVKASNTGRTDNFGASVALAGDGSTLAVGAYAEDSGATGIDGTQNDESKLESGAAYIFTRTGAKWSQQAYVKASNTGMTAQFGWSLAMSPDGTMLAVAAVTEDSNAIGIGGNQDNLGALASGAVYMFRRDAAGWRQQAYIKASNTGTADQFGWSVSIAADGTLAVGAPGEDGAATGVGGDKDDNSAQGAGAAYVVR